MIKPVFIIVLVAILCYFNSLKGEFQFDDKELLQKPWIADTNAFNENVDWKALGNRPALLFTFAVNNQLSSGNSFGFHLINLFLHCNISLLIFFILKRVSVLISKPLASSIPFIATLIFTVHPLNVDAVTYISSRSSLLAAFFYLSGIYLFACIFSQYNQNIGFRSKIAAWTALLLIFYLALASKLISATMPLILFLAFLFIIAPVKLPGWSKKALSPRFLTAYAFFIIMGFASIIFFPEWIYNPRDHGMEFYGRDAYFFSQFKVIVFYYLKLFILPFNFNIDPGFPLTRISNDPAILLSILLLTGIGFSVLRWGNFWTRSASVWFVITIAPTSSLMPLNDLAVEHRMYLPMTLGSCLLAGWMAERYLKGKKTVIFILVLSALASLTVHRNNVWSSEIKLWQDSARKNPNSPRPRNNLGRAFYEAGNWSQAEKHLSLAVKNLSQTNHRKNWNIAEPHYNIANLYLDSGRLEDAQREYETALKIKPGDFQSALGLGSVHNQKGGYNKALSYFDLAIQLRKRRFPNEDYSLARLNRGEIFGKTGRFSRAITEFEMALRQNPSLFQAQYNLGIAYLAINEPAKAEQAFLKTLRMNPDFNPALKGISRAKELRQNPGD